MQPQRNLDLAGIAPEAWERVRAAAAQDGLAVDEWLQRRLREQNSSAPHGQPSAHVQKRESKAEPTPVSKNRISEAVQAMSRLLEANEPAQQQAHHAMASLTSEITTASHEQANAFEELKERIAHLEQNSEASEMREGFVDERLNAVTEKLRATDAVATRCVQIDNRIDTLATRLGKLDDVAQAIAKHGSQQAENSAKIETQAEQFETLAHAVLAAREDMKSLERSLHDQLQTLAERMESTESTMATQQQYASIQGEAKQFEKSTVEKLQALIARMESAEFSMVTQPQFAAVQDDIKRFEGSVENKLNNLGARVDAGEAIMVTQPQFAAVQEDMLHAQQSTVENLSALTARVGSAEAAMATKLQFTTVQEDAERFEQKSVE